MSVLLLLLLVGCVSDQTRQEVANSAATNWEAAEAIRLGADPKGPIEAIQANSTAQAHAMGFQYPVQPVPASPVKGSP